MYASPLIRKIWRFVMLSASSAYLTFLYKLYNPDNLKQIIRINILYVMYKSKFAFMSMNLLHNTNRKNQITILIGSCFVILHVLFRPASTKLMNSDACMRCAILASSCHWQTRRKRVKVWAKVTTKKKQTRLVTVPGIPWLWLCHCHMNVVTSAGYSSFHPEIRSFFFQCRLTDSGKRNCF